MNELAKITDLSARYGVTARTLRYYEDIGLLNSSRSDDYAYRMYDNEAVRRLEQILILRKLNISIKDIQRVFDSSGSQLVLEILEKKVGSIDDEVALLHELKEIILDFIREIEKVNFSENNHIQLLYNKAKEIETHFDAADYEGKPSRVHRLHEIADKLDKKIPDVMIVRIPACRAVTSGSGDFSSVFKLMDWAWDAAHKEERSGYFEKIIFDANDFLKRRNGQFEYIMTVNDQVTPEQTAPFNIVDFEGGLYALAVSIDGDDESIHKVEKKILQWIENTNFCYDDSRDIMGHMTYCDDEIKRGLGYEQLQRYVPIRVKDES